MSIITRYRDAYSVANNMERFGNAIKSIGIGLAILLFLLIAVFTSSLRSSNSVGTILFSGVILALLTGVFFFSIGTWISAQGQLLKATLDTAVNSSPFLTNDQKASVMSLVPVDSSQEFETLKSEAHELQSIATDRKSAPGSISAEEIPKWRSGLRIIGWFEEIGHNTHIALSKDPNNPETTQEPLLCVAYADAKGAHISDVWFNKEDLTSPHTALVSTPTRIFLIQPAKKVVISIAYTDISQVQIGMMSNNKKTYELTTIRGDTARIDVIFSKSADESITMIVDAFFNRISSVRQ
jgi:hypothetical protein